VINHQGFGIGGGDKKDRRQNCSRVVSVYRLVQIQGAGRTDVLKGDVSDDADVMRL